MRQWVTKDDLRLGMFVQAIEGNWLEHPFWRSRFLLSEPADLQALRESGVDRILIDLAKGVGVETGPLEQQPPAPWPEAEASASPPPQRQRRIRMPAAKAPPTRHSAAEELSHASRVLERSKEEVRKLFGEVRLGKAVASAEVMPLVDEISSSVARNPSALISIARLKNRNEYTYMHSVAVCALMVNLARQLDLDAATTREAGLAGLLHDVGKMAMPEPILSKPAALSDEEFAIMRTHPERGWEVLRRSGGMPQSALDVCLHHHERVDGTGYPHGLAGDGIDLLARMGAVCDVYDAVTSCRPYKDPWGAADTIAAMFRWKGHFDRPILDAFIRSVGIYPVGSLVRLKSNRLAVVADQNEADLTRPTVKTFLCAKTGHPIPIQAIDLSASEEDAIAAREEPRDWRLTPWGARWQKILAHPVAA